MIKIVSTNLIIIRANYLTINTIFTKNALITAQEVELARKEDE